MISSTTDLVFVLLIAAAGIFYASRHLLRKNQLPVFIESLLIHHTKTVAIVLLLCVGILVAFGLISIFYAVGPGSGPS